MKIKTSELSGIALDWAVAHIIWESGRVFLFGESVKHIRVSNQPDTGHTYQYSFVYSPSSDWSQGGPIIEREGIWLGVHSNDECGAWYPMHQTYYGITYLEAAMRCYVASKLGEEVEVPDDLLP